MQLKALSELIGNNDYGNYLLISFMLTKKNG